MIELNLIPLNIRELNVGRDRFYGLVRSVQFYLVFEVLLLGAMFLSPGRWLLSADGNLRAAVALLENDIAAEREAIDHFNQNMEVVASVVRKRHFALSALEAVWSSMVDGVTLQRVDISHERFVVAGVARDATALAELVMALREQWPGVQVAIEKVSKESVGAQSAERFTLRVGADEVTNTALGLD